MCISELHDTSEIQFHVFKFYGSLRYAFTSKFYYAWGIKTQTEHKKFLSLEPNLGYSPIHFKEHFFIVFLMLPSSLFSSSK
jgi:hypothetical protein